jgi:hypothetical protein
MRYDLLGYSALLPRANVNEPHDATMGQATPDRQFAKVLVKRDEYALFPMRLRQDAFIAWILREIAGPKNVMSGSLEFRLGAAPDASIQKQLHAADSIFKGSIRS